MSWEQVYYSDHSNLCTHLSALTDDILIEAHDRFLSQITQVFSNFVK